MPVADFMGRWNIFEMTHYDRESIDLMGPAHIAFDDDGGTLGFICVVGDIAWKLGKRGRVEALKFQWDGNDEMDEASGSGWAMVTDNEMNGEIAFRGGDRSVFKARRFG